MRRTLSRESPWLRGPVWDGVWVLNALWLAPLVLWLSRGDADPESSPVDLLYFALTALFWIGHRLCSTWLAYCTEAYRPLLRARPVRFVALPLLVTTACFAVFLPPDAAFPWTRAQRLLVLAIVDYACVTYHFAAQHFGALSLYRLRAGQEGGAYARRMDRLYALGVGGVLVFVADVLAGGVAYQDVWVDPWLVPAWLTDPLARDALRAGAALVLLASTAAMLCAEARAARPSLPRVLYVLGIAAIVAVGLHAQGAFSFLVLSTSQHWIVAVGLGSRTPSGEPAPRRGAVRRVFHGVNARPWALTLVLLGMSVLLMPFFEVEANRDGGTYYADRIFGALATGLRTSSWVPALLALGFATGFVHYLLDRSVYRVSDPEVRSAARGLLDRPATGNSRRWASRPAGQRASAGHPPPVEAIAPRPSAARVGPRNAERVTDPCGLRTLGAGGWPDRCRVRRDF